MMRKFPVKLRFTLMAILIVPFDVKANDESVEM
jgi:hypothetical protein